MTAALYPPFAILLVDDDPAWLHGLQITLERTAGLTHLIACQDTARGRRHPRARAGGGDRARPQHAAPLGRGGAGRGHRRPPRGGRHRGERDEPGRDRRPLRQGRGVRLLREDGRGGPARRAACGAPSACWSCSARTARWRRASSPARSSHPEAFAHIVTRNRAMLAIFSYVEAVARSPQPLLITGESGTGKELVARAAHALRRRKGRLHRAQRGRPRRHGLQRHALRPRARRLHRRGPGAARHDRGGRRGDAAARRDWRPLRRVAGEAAAADPGGRVLPAGQRPAQAAQRAPGGRHAPRPGRAPVRGDVPPRSLLPALHAPRPVAAAPRAARRPAAPPGALPGRGGRLAREEEADGPAAADPAPRHAPLPRKRPGAARLGLQRGEPAFGRGPLDRVVPEGARRAVRPRPRRCRRGQQPLRRREPLPTFTEALELLVDEALRRSQGNQTVAARLLGVSQPALSKRLKARQRGGGRSEGA